MSQAVKIYNGSSLPFLTLQFTCILTVMYVVTIAFFFLMTCAERGFAAAREELFESFMSNMYLAICGGFGVAVVSVQTFEKKLPGGKFFRSVKGGFDTYKKVRTALLLSVIIGICLYIGIIGALNAVVPIMNYGAATCVSVAVFLLLGVGIVNLISVIKNDLARTVLSFMQMFVLSVVGVFIVHITKGELGIVHIIAAILGIVLIPVSHKLMLASYRKRRWNT